MITVRQSLQQLGLLSNEADETVLYVRLNVLLRDPTIGMPYWLVYIFYAEGRFFKTLRL
jgi:hypothetical protein